MSKQLVYRAYFFMYSLGNYKSLRRECHQVKENNIETIIRISEQLSKLIDDDYILVPIPNHCGYADYTLKMANEIAFHTGLKVCDCLYSEPREMLYDIKKRGDKISITFMSKYIPDGKILLVDNVVDTGITFREAQRVLNKKCNLITIAYGTRGRLRTRI